MLRITFLENLSRKRMISNYGSCLSRPRAVPQETMDRIIDGMIPSGCTPAALQERIRRDTGTKLHITYTGWNMFAIVSVKTR